MTNIVSKIYEYSLEEIMEKRFADYSKYIIQERAIPDVRDGLKPVQRRILYSMHEDGNTYNKKFRKCAKTVGAVLGNYHPHGDTSVYDALIRLSQDWKQNKILVEVSGNNGSIDGDEAAAYRYTESRLAKISEALIGDAIKFRKAKINYTYNYDDTRVEPTVLPTRFPNLLVNGTTGISAGYATNMAPHNFEEVINATIKRIDSPECSLDSILKIIKGPDFPTGGIVEDLDELRKAYETGKGKIKVLCKYEITKEKNKHKIIITEIPYEVNKANLVKKIDEIRYNKKIDGISEVRDESDKENDLRIVIDLKTGANPGLIMNYLLKNTELQINYSFNNVAIINKRPKQLGILEILDAFINYRKFTMKESCKIDLDIAELQKEEEEGLIKAISILDEVIATIRASKNKGDAKSNLCEKYDFTPNQAEAIVMLQLYKLTNTDILLVKNHLQELIAEIERLKGIINDEEKLNNAIKEDLKSLKKEFPSPRKTKISQEVTDIKIDKEDLIKDEDIIVCLTNEGYIKKVSKKSYNKDEETGLKPGDYVLNLYEASTKDKIIIITNFGNYIYSPVAEVPDAKWKDLGKHISSMALTKPNEIAIGAFIINDCTKNLELNIFTKNGMVKKSKLDLFNVTRYNKVISAIKLKDEDEVIGASLDTEKMLVITKTGRYLKFLSNEVPTSGVKTSGVKAINLKDDEVVFASNISDEEYISIFTNKHTAKRMRLLDIEDAKRSGRGNTLIKKNKTVTYHVLKALLTNTKDSLVLKKDEDLKEIKNVDVNIMDKTSNGGAIKFKYDNIFKKYDLKSFNKKISNENNKEEVETFKLNNDENFEEMTIDDFLEEFKL